MIGLTLKYPTLAGDGKGPEQALIDSWGGLDAALSLLYRMNVRSIEISFIFSKMPDPVTKEILSRLYGAGMRVSIHGVLEDMTGEAYLERFDSLFRIIFDHQDDLSITLHGLTDLPATKRITGDWSRALLNTWPGITLAVESQRVRDESFPGEKEHFRINNIPATLPKSPNIGICWDMGHYAYNVVRSGLPIETVPSHEALSLVRHTHIHCLKDMDTHHPIVPCPISAYIAALKEAGYKGIYNIEVKADKYISYMDVRTGMEDSINTLREILGE